jgi:YD repeat-containing protein
MNNGYLWGGQNKLYPIAECKNATNAEFYYQGYEDLTTGVVIGSAHTGNKYTTGTSVSWTRPNGRSYVISYWKRTGSGPWTYSGEISYTGSSYTLSGGDSYDDVRIYPNDAQMSTYTYDPMTGVTSVTDMKGLTTYFEYDGLQRLMNVKDKDGNIVKNYKYNLQH